MATRYKGSFAFKTDIGRVRVSNEDQAAVATNPYGEVLLVVCDGMGGQNKGDYASKMAIDSILEAFASKRSMPLFLTKRWLTKALKTANALVFEEAERNPVYKDMGTTCVAVLIQGNKMLVSNIGDSRAYRYNGRELSRLTEDQTVVDYLYRTGKISKEEMNTREDRHVLTNALGVYPSCSTDLKIMPYLGEAILLCSDGLYNNVPENEIRAALSTDERADEKVTNLIAEANSNGGSDNIGIAYWETIKHD